MASVIVTLRIMPASPQTDLAAVEASARRIVSDFGGRVAKVEVSPIAFGLNAVLLHFVMDESRGSTEALESEVASVNGVNSVEVVDVRRAVG